MSTLNGPSRGGDIGGGCHSGPPSVPKAAILGSAGLGGTPRHRRVWSLENSARVDARPARLPSNAEFGGRSVPDAGGLVNDAVTMREPSGLKAAEVTRSSWPRTTAISLALAASQMRAVVSPDAVTMREPSGLKAADCTKASWPRRTAISLALAASQMRAVLSYDAVTMREPSGLKAA